MNIITLCEATEPIISDSETLADFYSELLNVGVISELGARNICIITDYAKYVKNEMQHKGKANFIYDCCEKYGINERMVWYVIERNKRLVKLIMKKA